MEAENIILYHTGMQGFVLRNSTYGTTLSEVRKFTRLEAEAFIKRAAPNQGTSPLLPIDADLLLSTRSTEA